MLYLTPNGPWSFTIEAEEGGMFPFRSNCEPGDNTEYYAAFTDVVVHDSAELSAELCSPELGTAVVRDGTLPTGYALTGFSLGGPQVYEVRLNASSADCAAPNRDSSASPRRSSSTSPRTSSPSSRSSARVE